MDWEARFKRLKEIKAKLQENYFVKQIGIFGSFVRGEEGGEAT